MHFVDLESLASLEAGPQATYPELLETLPEVARQCLANLIVDQTVELPGSNRNNQAFPDMQNDNDIARFYQPLVTILQLNPTTDRAPARNYFTRASKLDLIPSIHPIYYRGIMLGDIQTALGFRAKFSFAHAPKQDLIRRGMHLAKIVGGRPNRDDITAAGRGKGRYKRSQPFPTIDDIKTRFGKISTFHELIGYPSCKGWEKEDYLEWASAFFRQNPDISVISAAQIQDLSTKGVGPSKQPIIKHFGRISDFQKAAQEYHQQATEIEAQDKARRIRNMADLLKQDQTLSQILESDEDQDNIDRQLQVTAQYIVFQKLFNIQLAIRNHPTKMKNPNTFLEWCVKQRPDHIKAADVEITASTMGVFDDLWPMYRFQNVNLKQEP